MESAGKTMPRRREKRAFRTYIVTSCKGGIGKSTVTANLAMAVAARGHNVLMIDCDFSNRSLDLIMGVEDKVVYDICDLVCERSELSRCVIRDSRNENLYFIPAPLVKVDEFSPEKFSAAVIAAAEELKCEYVFIDTPGASDSTLPLVADVADSALIVASHQPTSVRGAEKMGVMLEDFGVPELHLVINRYDGEQVLKGNRPGINSLIDRTHVRLIGVIPDSDTLELEQENGILACQITGDKTGAPVAFEELAARICGERIPLMSFVNEKKRRKLLYS